jgi:hypothetical protein
MISLIDALYIALIHSFLAFFCCHPLKGHVIDNLSMCGWMGRCLGFEQQPQP